MSVNVMSDHDVRDVKGRLQRLVAAALIGALVAPVIAFAFPQTSSRGWGGGVPWLGGIILVAAGAVGIALAVYAWLGASRRAPRGAQLPAARVVRASSEGRGRCAM